MLPSTATHEDAVVRINELTNLVLYLYQRLGLSVPTESEANLRNGFTGREFGVGTPIDPTKSNYA